MQTVTVTETRTVWTGSELRAELKARGISVRQFAAAAGDYPSNVYAVLEGVPVGRVRRARYDAAARELGLFSDDSGEDS